MIKRLFSKPYHTVRDVFNIYTTEGKISKKEKAKGYLTLISGSKKNKTKFMGYTVYFTEYPLLKLLFKEIFIKEQYASQLKGSNLTILDCGSNIGIATLYFKKVFPDAKITCFEPNTEAFQLLEKNIEENNIKGVTLVNKALSDFSGKTIMFKEKNVIGSLKTNTTPSRLKENVEESKVACEPLSKYIKKEIDLMKLDIEGGEGKVLTELEKSGKLKKIKNMIIEFHENIPGNLSLTAFLKILETAGFEYILKKEKIGKNKESMQDILIYATRKK